MDIIARIKDLNEFLPKGAIKRNSIYYEYVTYVSHIVYFFISEKYDYTALFIRRAYRYLEKHQNNDPEYQKYIDFRKIILKDVVEYILENNLISEWVSFLKDEIIKAPK